MIKTYGAPINAADAKTIVRLFDGEHVRYPIRAAPRAQALRTRRLQPAAPSAGRTGRNFDAAPPDIQAGQFSRTQGLRRKLKEPSSAGQSPAASLCSQRTTSHEVSNRASFIPSVCQNAHVHVKQNTTYEHP